jgi:DNA repair exonuclease SbcCD nuclease subunit
VRQAAEHLRRFSGIVIVLPGNHDYIESGSDSRLWPEFMEALGDRHLVLGEPRIYDLSGLDFPLVLYAAPCRSRHSKINGLGWMHEARQQDTAEHLRVAVAHGSLSGLSPDFNQEYFPMEREELQRLRMDLWLLGHTHVRYPNVASGQEERIFFPSVPEPDGFDCQHEGYAWIIDMTFGQIPRYRSVTTGAYRFHELEFSVESEHDLDQVASQLSKLRPDRDLVKLKLHGRLEQSLLESLHQRNEASKRLVKHIEVDASRVLQLIQQAQIDEEFTEGSFAHRLLSELAKTEEDCLALQLAHQLIVESK